MAGILGLIDAEDLANYRYKSARRKVFYDYPNGAFPLTGLLSLAPDEVSSDPEYQWWEKRYKKNSDTTKSNTTGPFGGAAAATPNQWGSTARTGGRGIGTGGAITANDKISVYVNDLEQFRVGHIIKLEPLTLTGGGIARLVGRVWGFNATGPTTTVTTHPGSGAGWLDITILTVTDVAAGDGFVNNSAVTNVGVEVLVVGSANEEGQVGSSRGVWMQPVNPTNYCQIFRQKFDVTGTAQATNLKYDSDGPHRDRAKEASVDHMTEIEKGIIFGERGTDTGPGGRTLRYTGGIIWFLRQWELAGADSNNLFKYRGTTAAAATANSDDDKRIIRVTNGRLSEKDFDTYVERAFRVTNNKANEKLVVCGNGSLQVINQLYRSKSVLNDNLPLDATYGMDVVRHRTPFGTMYYKTHPLFNQSTMLRNCMLILDVGNLKYRYLNGRDSDILENRQANDEDSRVDEWLAECGIEVNYPESHMFITNILDYIP